MPRPRVLSFMSQWGGGGIPSRNGNDSANILSKQPPPGYSASSAASPASYPANHSNDWSQNNPAAQQNSSSNSNRHSVSQRPLSMVQTYQPPVMDVAKDTIPELMPIFQFLNSHSNKLYQEGYFLKLNDLDARGRPSGDRTWTECFAQLVGTVLSLWDASLLDQAGHDGEVIPTFINLADASIKMMPSLPMNGPGGQKLDNVLSISTAAKNRYLLHFNSLNSLTQWTAGIRLSMYEHATLQEAYTGSLIAGKGKTLNSIRSILDKTRFKHEDWARVRFGAGTPWRRCWCVVSPPDEKELQKLQKQMKKTSIYDRHKTILKGDIKFYESKKVTKKSKPIATIRDAYSAYAVFPQSKPLIEQSTLVKVEGQIMIHSTPESATEGFVFIMPDVHPAVSGFEIMLRFLFPVFDVFNLYGRPERLIADVLDSRGLMFAMPSDRRYGYLDLLDVAGLIHTEGSQNWNEREWRKRMKDLTSQRMSNPARSSRNSSRRNTVSRVSLPPSRGNHLRFDDNISAQSQPGTRRGSPTHQPAPVGDDETFDGPRRVDSAPPAADHYIPRHQRSISEANGYRQYNKDATSRLRNEHAAPLPPAHQTPVNDLPVEQHANGSGYESDYGRGTPEAQSPQMPPELQDALSETPPPAPVAAPPSFKHAPREKPRLQPYQSPELLRANSNVDADTLQHIAATSAGATGIAAAGAAAAWKTNQNRWSNEHDRHLNSGSPHYQSQVQQSYMPTIPASPFIERDQPVMSHEQSYPDTPPPVPPHDAPPEYGAVVPPAAHSSQDAYKNPANRPGLQGRGNSSNSVHRKPLPGRSSFSPSRGDAASTGSDTQSLNSLRDHVIDPEALDRLSNPNQRPNQHLVRQPTTSSSVYDDTASVASSTDYASTVSSRTRQQAVRRDLNKPRVGVLKTVGTPQSEGAQEVRVGETLYGSRSLSAKEETPAIDIDFGPTYAVAPEVGRGRTDSSGMAADDSGNRSSHSRERLGEGQRDGASRLSMYAGGRPTSTYNVLKDGYRSNTPVTPNEGGSSGRATPSYDNRRSVAWNPGMAQMAAAHATRQSLTAEEWVQARASIAAQPQAPINQRRPSPTNIPSANTGLARQSSADWSQMVDARASHVRTPTADRLPVRPHSRGPSMMLQPQQTLMNQQSASLSAREQEFVARATGTSLLQLQDNKVHQRAPSAGLVGAIEAREQEKRDLKQVGMAGTRVQSAMFMRQQVEQQRHAQQQYAQQQAFAQQQAQASMLTKLRPQSSYGNLMTAPSPSIYGAPSVGMMQQGNLSQPNLLSYGQQPSPMYSGSPMGQQNAQGYFPMQQQQMYMQHQPVQQAYGASWDAQQAGKYNSMGNQGHR